MKCKLFCGMAAAVAFVVHSGICRAEGNASALLFDGTLFIVGDSGNHDLTITGDVDGGELLIEGDLVDSYPLAALDGLVILTGGGDDHVHVHGTIPGDLWISSGAGKDNILIFSITTLGDVVIESGRDWDKIEFANITVYGSLAIKTNEGDDVVVFSSGSSASSIEGNLHLSTGLGEDVAIVSSFLIVGGNLLFEMGQHDDYLAFNSWRYGAHLVTVGGSASLHGDQGHFDDLSLFRPLEVTIGASDGIEVDGFE